MAPFNVTLLRIFIFGLVLLAGSSAARADEARCRAATEKYNAALKDTAGALRDYGNCVSASRARDACTDEFARLPPAQASFAASVAGYRTDCW